MGNDDSDESRQLPPPPPSAPPAGYGPPPAGAQAQPPTYGAVGKSNGLAIASMVLGIVSLVVIFAFYVSWIGSILALIFGYVANRQIARSQGAQRGRGMAIAGIVLGWIGSVLAVVIVTAVVLVAILGDNGHGSSSTNGPPFNVQLGQPWQYDDGVTIQIYQYSDSAAPADQPQPPATGKQFAFADVEFCAGPTADALYRPTGFDVIMPDGHRYQAALAAANDAPATVRQPALGRGDIPAGGGCQRGWVTLEVPADQRPASIVWNDPQYDETRWHLT